ncbi:uncharacterized protein LOC119099099 [Pollicipes pollicipes]|uniref:uncharacterized protein LOC119099099 n=1 Tax=Pollicipes pollicipes TaxID=41117 RepID=UPI001885A146|nr:uncharacterized protein LOC119099099 [Pollicipes pollicipes]
MRDSCTVLTCAFKKAQDEETELMAAISKLQGLKNKLKVEELILMAEMRQRSMQAARAMCQTSTVQRPRPATGDAPPSPAAGGHCSGDCQRPPVAADPLPTAGISYRPLLELTVPSASYGGPQEEEEEDDDDDDDEC